MAIINGPYASKMRGKVGEVVAAKTTGNRTALRSYQPNVKNPNTLRQQLSRAKMSIASKLAASFSYVIAIGFAKAASGTKMYPRNMFVKEVVPLGANVITGTLDNLVVGVDNMKVSEACGISCVPVVNVTAGTQEGSKKIVADNASSVVLSGDEKLGLVVAAFQAANITGNPAVLVKMGDAAEGVTITSEELTETQADVFYAFYKVIPNAVNGITTDTIPWKYPSATSASVFGELNQ